MTNEEKFKTPEERQNEFDKFCSTMKQCAQCDILKRNNTRCILNWLAAEYKAPKQDLPFIVKTEVRNGCEVRTICSFCGEDVISCWNVIEHCKAYCDHLNAVALAWHERMNEKEGRCP